MVAIYISVYGVQAQWNTQTDDLISNKLNLIIAPSGGRIYFGNGSLLGNNFLNFSTAAGGSVFGYSIRLNGEDRFVIYPSNLGRKTLIESDGNADIILGNTNNNSNIRLHGTVYPKLISFTDNTTLNSANFLTSITGNSNRIGTITMQITTLSSGLVALQNSLNVTNSGLNLRINNLEVLTNNQFATINTSLNGINASLNSQNTSISGLNSQFSSVNTQLNSQNVSISGLNSQFSILNSSLSNSWQTKSTGLYYCGNTTICGNTDINSGIIRLGGPMPNPPIYRHCFNYQYNNNGTIITGFATCQENTDPNFTMSGLILGSRTVLTQQPYAMISNNSTGITLAHNINNPVIITPQGSIKFRDNSEIGPGTSLFRDVAESKIKTQNIFSRILGTNTLIGIGTSQPIAHLHVNGIFRARSATIENLSGTGIRMLVADATGRISSQALPIAGVLLADFSAFQTANTTRINTLETSTNNKLATLETNTNNSINAVRDRNLIVFGGSGSGESIERNTSDNCISIKTGFTEKIKIENGAGKVRFPHTGGIEVANGNAILRQNIIVGSGEGEFISGNADMGISFFSRFEERLKIENDGRVKIGNLKPISSITDVKLSVDGRIYCKRVTILDNNQWADYVFEKKYNLLPLLDLEKYINKNKHLPEIPSSNNINENGIDISEMLRLQMAKIEELTLYIIEQEKRMIKLEVK